LDDVLDLSKAEAGCMQVEPVAQELKALIASICAFWREEAAQQGLSFDVVLAPDLPERIMVDPTRLTQAVSNLLSNAIKFTKDGGVRVEVDGRPKGSRWELSISVTDTGIGISADTQARLFQTFTQGDSSITRRYGGTGVGLALTRHIVVLMDGRIAVESAPGAGSTFRITLPVSLPGPSAAKPAPAATPGAMAELAGLRVLVIDDVETNRFVARLMLEPVGAIVSEAASGAEGLALLREQDFDLALVDLHMPDLDGIETVRRLRAEPRSAALPVLLLTADATWRPGPDIACLSIAGTVMKPVEPDTLHDAIRSAATGSRAQPSKDRAIH
ncbi:MAG: ATP-binding protein, partial [Pseudomonadota bacterium]